MPQGWCGNFKFQLYLKDCLFGGRAGWRTRLIRNRRRLAGAVGLRTFSTHTCGQQQRQMAQRLQKATAPLAPLRVLLLLLLHLLVRAAPSARAASPDSRRPQKARHPPAEPLWAELDVVRKSLVDVRDREHGAHHLSFVLEFAACASCLFVTAVAMGARLCDLCSAQWQVTVQLTSGSPSRCALQTGTRTACSTSWTNQATTTWTARRCTAYSLVLHTRWVYVQRGGGGC